MGGKVVTVAMLASFIVLMGSEASIGVEGGGPGPNCQLIVKPVEWLRCCVHPILCIDPLPGLPGLPGTPDFRGGDPA